MNEKLLNTNGVTICTETFGDKNHPPVLLIMGATASMLYWDEIFCKKLAGRGFYVVRYDNRDVGKSTTYPKGASSYNIVDLVDDAIGILDVYNIEEAHFFGMSLGGLIAQIAALNYPERVRSLTLLATGPWGESDSTIPEMDHRIIQFHEEAAEIDWNIEEEVVSYMIKGSQLMSGKKNFDPERSRKLFSDEFKRANNYISMFNHATLQGGEEFYGKIDQINKKCLIIHGDADIVWNYAHAAVLKKTLKNSRLVTLQNTGHELHPKDWDTIINAFCEENL